MVCTMRRKIQRAVGLVKDHASLTRAMMFSGNGIGALEMAVVQATSHDEAEPVDDKYVHEILFIVSNTSGSVLHLASFLTKRLERTRDNVVALKLLMLVHRLLRGGHRRFEQDLRDTHSSGVLRLRFYGLRVLRGEGPAAASSALVSFLHDYASFLELRMGWFINQAGRLEPTAATTTTQFVSNSRAIGTDDEKIWAEPILTVLPRCQEILDRIVQCFPASGMVRRNHLVQAALESILRESFHLYASFSDGVGTLLDLLKQGVRDSGLALHILKRASHQSYELVRFFDSCKAVCSVRFDDYPSVKIIISREDVSKMEELLRGCVLAGSEASKVVDDDDDDDDDNDDGDDAGADVSSGSSSSPSSPGTVVSTNTFKSPLLCTSPMRLFSRRWQRETKVSTEWVVFDNDDNSDKLREEAISLVHAHDAGRSSSCWRVLVDVAIILLLVKR
ncbi:putative clathrin assembly protein [Nymphaea thermarum]|nr:putative clathrin assembly protein [Nymphaea thermarum]